MMITFKVYTVFDKPLEEATINTKLVAWVSQTEECGLRDRRQTCNIHFSGGGICSYVIGSREEISEIINKANSPQLLWGTTEIDLTSFDTE